MVTLLAAARQILTGAAATPDAVLTGAALVLSHGIIEALGDERELRARYPDARVVDCSGSVITPGLIDSHTHALFGTWRAHEYELRCRGTPYMEIARRGGGINASVRDLRARSEDELVELALPRFRELCRFGVTTVEVKSGYGLSTEDELKQLRAIRRVAAQVPLDVVPTFLGAHEFPPEFRDRRDAYVDLLVNEMIPAVAAERLAVFCDAFMEPGVFDARQTRRILQAGLDHGLTPKLHADELENSGGAELAVELGAASADHLGAISNRGVAALAGSSTVATLLPATLFFLGRQNYAPARALIDAGATVALATDFNPGSSPSANLPLVLTIACSQMRMDPLEALVAATAGGARALRLSDGRGILRNGAPADLAVWAVNDYREIPYRFGIPALRALWKRGAPVTFGL
ncbi:MAG TPA: imidazolonepropionase [Longimicrobiales bacterium]|nr:imidazolonepropionase [Longimicrobiales bacterium]